MALGAPGKNTSNTKGCLGFFCYIKLGNLGAANHGHCPFWLYYWPVPFTENIILARLTGGPGGPGGPGTGMNICFSPPEGKVAGPGGPGGPGEPDGPGGPGNPGGPGRP